MSTTKKVKVTYNSDGICNEPFLYSRRLKAILTTYKGRNMYKVILYKHNKEIYKERIFFDSGILENDYKGQVELYQKALKYARNYLQTCKY